MNIDVLIDSIYQLQGKEKLELIQELSNEIEENGDLIINDLKRVFIMIEVLLRNKNEEIISSTLKLTEILTNKIQIPQELEQPFQLILQGMINQLGNSDNSNRKLAKKIIVLFVKRTRNIEMVFNDLIKHGFTHQQFFVRQSSIKIVPKLIMTEQSIFSSYSGINDIRRVIENIIIRYNDSVQSVREQSAKTLYKIKEEHQQNFDLTTRRLADVHQESLSKIIESQKKKPEQKFYEAYIEQLKKTQQDYLKSFTSQQDYVNFLNQAIPDNIEEILEFFPQKHNLYFGFINKENFINSFNNTDVNVRQNAVKLITETFLTLNYFDLLHQSLAKFFKYILKLLQDNNNTIKQSALEMLNKLIQSSGIHVSSYVNLCLPTLADLLGQEMIQIRLTCFQILRQLIFLQRRNWLLLNFMSFLKEKQKSWQYYFELLKLICYIFLDENTKKEEWYLNIFQTENEDSGKIFKENDFKNVIETVAVFLDHDTNKVKHMCFNLLALITCSIHQYDVQQILHEILDTKVYEDILDKVQKKEVYFLNNLDLLELPVIEIEKFDKHKDDYEEHRRLLEELRLQKEKEQELLRQQRKQEEFEELKRKEREKFTKQKVIPKAKNEILELNKQYDSYFEFNNKQNDNYKYDIVIPVNNIRMTTGNVNDFYANTAMKPQQSASRISNREDLKTDQENSEVFDKKQQEFNENSRIHKNKYVYQPKVEIEYPESEASDIHHEQPNYQLQYHKDDVKLNLNHEQQRIKDMENINSRIQKSVKENDDKKTVYNIPLVVQANVHSYQAYEYRGGKSQVGSEIDIEPKDMFLDFKEIKKIDEGIQQRKEEDRQKYQKYIDEMNAEEERRKQEEEQQRINYFMMPTKERYLKKMILFLEHDEDEDIVQVQKMQKQPGTYKPNIKPGKRNRQQKKQQIKTLEEYNIPNRNELLQLQSPASDVKTAVFNIKSTSWQVLFNTINNLRCVNRHNFELLFKPEVSLKVLIQDILALCDRKHTSLTINVLVCLKEMVETLKEALNINVSQIIAVCLRQSLDTDENIVTYARQVLVAVGIYNYYSNIVSMLLSSWDSNNLQLKISIGLVMEQVVIKITKNIQCSDTKGFQDMLYIISLLIQDESFEVRRLGKKIFFKMLNSELDDETLLKQIRNKCHNYIQLFGYINKYKELFKDDKELYLYREEVHKDPLDNYVEDQKYSIFDNKVFNPDDFKDIYANDQNFIQREETLKFL